MIKCGVCGSENEAAALFCGTCGSPLSPAEAKAIADDAEKTTISTTPDSDEAIVPGKGGARRDLGTGGPTAPKPDETVVSPPPPEEIADVETVPGGPTITCGVCGTVNDATRTYCRKCANELKPAPPPPPPPPPPPTPRRISPLAIGLGAAAVVVAIALIGVLVLGGGTPGVTLGPSAQATAGPTTGPTTAATAAPTILPTPTARTFTEGALSGQIAFARCAADGSSCSIYLGPANGSAKVRRIIGATGASALDPSISPDGKQIIYVVEPGLRVVTISSRSFVQHSTGSGDTNPDWSPDGKQITFAGHRNRDNNGNDLEIRLDGLKSSSSSRPLTENDVVDHDPVFTPDGKSIVFVQGSGDDRELKLIDIASGDITDLTNDAFPDEDPAVSPLGNELVYASNRGDGYDLFLLDMTTLQVTPLPAMAGNEHDPAWSPGGRYIVFSGGKDGSKHLFILDLKSMKTTAFTTAGGSDIEPSWR